MVGEGCFLTAVPTLEPQAWTGRGIRQSLHPSTGAQGGQEVEAAWECPGLRREQAGCWPEVLVRRRELSLPEWGCVSEGLDFGSFLCSPRGRAKGPPAEFLHAPRLALLSLGLEENVQWPLDLPATGCGLGRACPFSESQFFNL